MDIVCTWAQSTVSKPGSIPLFKDQGQIRSREVNRCATTHPCQCRYGAQKDLLLRCGCNPSASHRYISFLNLRKIIQWSHFDHRIAFPTARFQALSVEHVDVPARAPSHALLPTSLATQHCPLRLPRAKNALCQIDCKRLNVHRRALLTIAT